MCLRKDASPTRPALWHVLLGVKPVVRIFPECWQSSARMKLAAHASAEQKYHHSKWQLVVGATYVQTCDIVHKLLHLYQSDAGVSARPKLPRDAVVVVALTLWSISM